MERSVELRVYGELNDFLAAGLRFLPFDRPLGTRQSVKDLIEASGIPHPEVGAVVAAGKPVGFDHQPDSDALIEVYPASEVPDGLSIVPLRPPAPRRPLFVVDSNLGGLARHLRMLGFDALFRNDFADDEIARISALEGRVLLTRDADVLKRKEVVHGRYVRTTEPQEQVSEVVRRYDLVNDTRPFSRCMECNEVLETVGLEAVKDHVPESVKRDHVTFSRCRTCGRVYWPGSHHRRMQTRIEDILRNSVRPSRQHET